MDINESYTINLIKNGSVVANCYYSYETFLFLSVIKRVIRLIDNYNRHLSDTDKLWNWNDSMIAIRIFEEENKDGNKRIRKPALRKDSYEYAEKYFLDFNIATEKQPLFTEGLIGITAKDKSDNRAKAGFNIWINLDKAEANFGSMLLKHSESDYDGNASKLLRSQIDFYAVALNDLKEAADFIDFNNGGFISHDDLDIIYVPYI